MYIRPLTDAELDLIKEMKKLANMKLTKQRQALARQIKKTSNYVRKKLQQERDNLRYIIGKPVIVSMNGGNMLIDYELLLKLDRSLKRRGYHREISIKGHTLVIEHPKGFIELNELPEHQAELLVDLPVIDLSESE